jgi:hypothetical protein
MPIEPVDPSKKVGGNGNEKYNPPKEKFGPSEYDKAAEKVKEEKAKSEAAKAEVSRIAEAQKAKAEAERPRTYAERLQDMGRLPKPSGGGGGGGGIKSMKYEPKTFKSGGKISASSRADGIAQRGKTRGKII